MERSIGILPDEGASAHAQARDRCHRERGLMNDRPLKLDGIYPPIPTPFDVKGAVDVEALLGNLRVWNQHALRGIVALGSNGEAVLLDPEERIRVVETVRSSIPADRLLIAGTGCQGTRETIDLTRRAAAAGADAVLILPPSYYRGRMTPDALASHFAAVADAATVPVILYNMPACTGIDLDAQLVGRLADHGNIIGMKDSGGDLVKMGAIRERVGPGFQILAGSASFLLPALSVGAVGGVLALANIAPEACLEILHRARDGRMEEARQTQVRMVPVNTAVTRRWGVAGLKAAMEMIGLRGGAVRAPLQPLNEEERQELRAILVRGGVLSE